MLFPRIIKISILSVLVLICAHSSFAEEKGKGTSYLLQKMKEWRSASIQHEPGLSDTSAVDIGNWSSDDLGIVIDYVTKLASQSPKKIRRSVTRAPIRSRLQLTAQEVKQGDLNRVLKQGALLHTDIAVLNLGTGKYTLEKEQMVALIDGRRVAVANPFHWEFARRLIESVAPDPSKDMMVKHWYHATTANMLSSRHLAFADKNIKSALELFPKDNRFLFYAGLLHETWALPVNQNVDLPLWGSFTYGEQEKELKKARKYFKKAIESNPEMAEAHLSLGRVLGLLGRHKDAIEELQLAAAMIEDPQLSYYASLYLGREFEVTSRRLEAREQYDQAAKLYPTAQSPLLALSQMDRNEDDIEAAFLKLQQIFTVSSESGSEDPRFTYDLAHVRDAPTLLAEMYRVFGELAR